MVKENNTRRTFFKRAAAAVGIATAAGNTKSLISSPSGSTIDGGDNYAGDAALQEKALSKQQLVLMTDQEKNKLLEVLMNNNHKDFT